MQTPNSPSILRVSPSVYASYGFDTSGIAMLEGTDGIVLVDVGANPYMAALVFSKFREITKKPLKAVIYTHSHPDHTMGMAGIMGAVEAEGQDPKSVQIWGREGFGTENVLFAHLGNITQKRGDRQFGKIVPDAKKKKALGADIPAPDPGTHWKLAKGPFPPTHRFAQEKHVLEIAGLKLELLAMPGETADQLNVWFPAERVLFMGDNMYDSFPNLYAVRGAGYRDVKAWTESLLRAKALAPEHVHMGHSVPLTGADICASRIQEYYDAITYVFTETLKGMDEGKDMEELAATIKLPPHLAAKDYLKEYYGNIAYSVRSIFAGHLGWFDGHAWKLLPLPPMQEATRMVEMAGGMASLLTKAEQSLGKAKAGNVEEASWAAQLTSYALRLESGNAKAKSIHADALEILGNNTLSATGGHYLLASAQELRV